MLTETEKNIINNDNPTNQAVSAGTELYDASANGLYVLTCDIAADATGGKAVDIPFACQVLFVIVEARATSGDGTAIVKKGSTAITDAIDMADDKTVTVSGTIDDDESTLAVSDTLTVESNGSDDRGFVSIVVKKV